MKLHTAEEVAAILRVPKGRVYELIRQGKLPALKIGRLVRVPEDELRAWAAGGGSPLEAPEERRSSEAPKSKGGLLWG